jgi:hypothetical protein
MRSPFAPGSIERFEGPTGPNPGAFLGTFIAGGSNGLSTPSSMLFGPDGKNDGKFDLFVTSAVLSSSSNGNGGTLIAAPGSSEVLRYDGTTGAFLSTFVAPDSGGLQFPAFMTFTETDPTKLTYGGRSTSAMARGWAATAFRSDSTTALAPLASSLLTMGQQSVPASPLLGLARPTALRPNPTLLLPAAGTPALAPARAADAVFAASHVATPEDTAGLFAPLASASLDVV